MIYDKFSCFLWQLLLARLSVIINIFSIFRNSSLFLKWFIHFQLSIRFWIEIWPILWSTCDSNNIKIKLFTTISVTKTHPHVCPHITTVSVTVISNYSFTVCARVFSSSNTTVAFLSCSRTRPFRSERIIKGVTSGCIPLVLRSDLPRVRSWISQ